MNSYEMTEWFGIIELLIKRSAMDPSYKTFALEGLDYLKAKELDGQVPESEW